MSEEIIHGAIPNASGNYHPATVMKSLFTIKQDEKREYDLVFTDNRIIRAKLSDGVTGKKTNMGGFFGLGLVGTLVDAATEVAAEMGELSKVGTGSHEAYEEQREKYQAMGANQILAAEKHNIDVHYNDINIVWRGQVGKMCSINFKTSEQRHSYDFPAVYKDKAQQLIQTFLSEKFTDKPSMWD